MYGDRGPPRPEAIEWQMPPIRDQAPSSSDERSCRPRASEGEEAVLSPVSEAIARLKRRATEGDDGFSLLEAVVSMSILLIMSVSILSLLIGTMKVQQVTRQRTDAAAYAQRELERISSWQYSDYMRIMEEYDGKYVASPFRVGNNLYYETINVDWSTNPANPTSGSPDYFMVSVEITWANMGVQKPVVAVTYIAPAGDIFAKNSGHVEAMVVDHLGAPITGADIELRQVGSLVSSYLNSDITGSAFFAYQTAGWYEVTASLAGYIGPTRQAFTSASNIQVAAGIKTPVTLQLAKPATITALLVDSANAPITSPFMSGAAVAYESANPIFAGGVNPVEFTNLFPGRYDIDGAAFECIGMSMSGLTGSLFDELVQPGDNNFTIQVTGGTPPTVTATVEVRAGDDLHLVQGAQVRLVSNCGQTRTLPTTNSQGQSSASGIFRGPYIMTITPPAPYSITTVYPVIGTDQQFTVIVD